MGNAFASKLPTYAYRYNTPDPPSPSPLVEHAAENYMMFAGTHVV